jgi:hypothetical protein
MCGNRNGASTSLDPCRHLHLQKNLQREQTCTVARSSWSEGHGCLATVFCYFSFFYALYFEGGFPMRFSLYPHLVQRIFFIWVPNMAFFPRPILYFHHIDVQEGCWSYFTHTPRIYFS